MNRMLATVVLCVVAVGSSASTASAQDGEALEPIPEPPATSVAAARDSETPPSHAPEAVAARADEDSGGVSWLPVPITAGVGAVALGVLTAAAFANMTCRTEGDFSGGSGSCGPGADGLIAIGLVGSLVGAAGGAILGLLIVPFTALSGPSRERDTETTWTAAVAPSPDGAEASVAVVF